jgi:hypothetical protein
MKDRNTKREIMVITWVIRNEAAVITGYGVFADGGIQNVVFRNTTTTRKVTQKNHRETLLYKFSFSFFNEYFIWQQSKLYFIIFSIRLKYYLQIYHLVLPTIPYRQSILLIALFIYLFYLFTLFITVYRLFICTSAVCARTIQIPKASQPCPQIKTGKLYIFPQIKAQ